MSDLPWPCSCGRTSVDGCEKCAEAGEWGRAIFETAKAASDHSEFGDAWRTYEGNTGFRNLPEHDRALIRVAFVSGWRAAMLAKGSKNV